MIDDKLRAAREQVGERLPAVRPVEDVRLGDAHPGQLAPLAAELVAQPREVLFLGQKPRARLDPFLAGNRLVSFHVTPPRIGPLGRTVSSRGRPAPLAPARPFLSRARIRRATTGLHVPPS